MNPHHKIYIAGHRGLVGSALVRRLQADGYANLLLRTRAELDLCNQRAVADFFQAEQPDFVLLAAAKVGGIVANHSYPADFITQNLQIQTNIITSAYQVGVKRLLFLGSSCIYPRLCPQPMREEHLLTGPLEPTNEPYAIAKIAGIKLCEAFNRQWGTQYISIMPTNLYGPQDNFNLQQAHVIPALMRKLHEAKQAGSLWVEIWGTGQPYREFLQVDDLAAACVFLMQHPQPPALVNIGTGQEITIRGLAELLAQIVGFKGELRFNASQPDGTPRKLLDISRLQALGWQPRLSLTEGLTQTYHWFLQHQAELRN